MGFFRHTDEEISNIIIAVVRDEIRGCLAAKVAEEVERFFSRTVSYEGMIMGASDSQLPITALKKCIDKIYQEDRIKERTIAKETTEYYLNKFKEEIGAEIFIDSIVERIKKKQL
jgi:hypothetical protein